MPDYVVQRTLLAKVDYHDPHIPATHKMRRFDLKMLSVDLSPEKVEGYDCVLIATHHTTCDWAMIGLLAKLIYRHMGRHTRRDRHDRPDRHCLIMGYYSLI